MPEANIILNPVILNAFPLKSERDKNCLFVDDMFIYIENKKKPSGINK